MNDSHYEKLELAIERAQEPGLCRYTQIDENDTVRPCCVIGQLCALEGISPLAMQPWDDGSHPIYEVFEMYPEAVKALGAYDVALLCDLQLEWDACKKLDREVRTKFKMLTMVHEYRGNHE